MITEYTRYQIPHDVKLQFLIKFERLSKLLNSNADCLAFDLVYDDNDSDSFILRITWQSISSFKRSKDHYTYLQIVLAYRRFAQKPQYFHHVNFGWSKIQLQADLHSFCLN